MDLSGNNNNNELHILNKEELDNIDHYKSSDLIQAINECNTYVQTGAIITMLDSIGDNNICSATRTVEALSVVMNYVNKGSIIREALVEVIYNLFQYAAKHNLSIDSPEFKQTSFTIEILQQILYENTYFYIYTCKKSFIPKLNEGDVNFKVKRNNILYLLDTGTFKINGTDTIQDLYVFFDVISGNWLYLTKDEMQNLKEQSMNKFNQSNIQEDNK